MPSCTAYGVKNDHRFISSFEVVQKLAGLDICWQGVPADPFLSLPGSG